MICAPQVSQTRGAQGHSKDKPLVIHTTCHNDHSVAWAERGQPWLWECGGGRWGLEQKEDVVWWKYMWQPSLVLWRVSLSLESHQLWLWTQLGNSWGQNGCCKPRQSSSHHVVLLQGRKGANSVRKKNLLHLLDIKIFAPWKSCIGSAIFSFACDMNLICWAKAPFTV